MKRAVHVGQAFLEDYIRLFMVGFVQIRSAILLGRSVGVKPRRGQRGGGQDQCGFYLVIHNV